MNAFRYSRALVRQVASTMRDQCLRHDKGRVLDLEAAIKEHSLYIDALKGSGLDVHVLPADDKYPDCVFVEDCAVVVGQKALITQPGHESRRGEVAPVKEALSNIFNIETTEIEDPSAKIDGGDVVFTGREFFVGMSNRTNQNGANALKKVFSDFPVTSVPLNGNGGRLLHLKEIMTMYMEDIIAIRGSDEAKPLRDTISSLAQFQYKFLKMEKDTSVNMLYFNNTHLHLTRNELGETDFKTLSENTSYPRIEMPNLEHDKADGSLTCRTILIQ